MPVPKCWVLILGETEIRDVDAERIRLSVVRDFGTDGGLS